MFSANYAASASVLALDCPILGGLIRALSPTGGAELDTQAPRNKPHRLKSLIFSEMSNSFSKQTREFRLFSGQPPVGSAPARTAAKIS